MIRSDERLDYAARRPDLRRRGARRRAVGGAAGGRARCRTLRWRTRRDRGSALAIESPEPEFAFDREGHVTSTAPERCRPSRTGSSST